MKILLVLVFSTAAFAAPTFADAQTEQSDSVEARRVADETAAAERAQREAQAAARRAANEVDVAASRAELDAARERLQQARSELEMAAQELARLSAAQYGRLEDRFVFDRNFIRMQRPMLGLNISNDEDGVRVVGVSPNGPGAAAGVQIGDLIVAIDDLDVSGSSAGNSTRLFLDRLGEVEAGSAVSLAVLRDGEPLNLTIETSNGDNPVWVGDVPERVYRAMRNVHVAPFEAPRGNFARTRSVFISGGWNDMQLVELTPQLGEYFGTSAGLLVVRAPNGEDGNLREGDVILQIGDRTPQSVGHAMRILASFEPGESLQLTIMREQRRRNIDVAVPSREHDIVVVSPEMDDEP